MARTSTLASAQLGALGRLKDAKVLGGLVLVGGGAIGFRLGHRRSRDLRRRHGRRPVPRFAHWLRTR